MHTHTDYCLSYTRVHNGSGVKLRFLLFPATALSSLWSGVDALFLLTTSQNSERRKGVLVFWKHRLKTECESELQSSTQLWCACATKFNEKRRSSWWTRTAQPQLCASAGLPAVLSACAPERVALSPCVSFPAPRGDFEYSDSIIDRFHWMICLH